MTQSKARRALADIGKVALATLVLILLLEAIIRGVYFVRNAAVDFVVLPYNAAQDFGPIPPWIDGRRILEYDDRLLWRNRRNAEQSYLDVFSPVREEQDRVVLLRQFIPDLPDYLADNPIWHVSLNDRGFRGPAFVDRKKPGVFRILCVGDSWTFGANVDQSETYPHYLRELIAKDFPDAEVEIINLGVFGYTSHQGLLLMRQLAGTLDPDLVLIGFGMNDASISGYRDKDTMEAGHQTPLQRILDHVETYKLFSYLSRIATYEYSDIGHYMKSVAEVAGTPEEAWVGRYGHELADFESLEPYTRVSPTDYEKNLREMTRIAKDQGADVILLYNQLWDTPYRDAVMRLAQSEGLQWVDSEAIIRAAKAEMAEGLETRLGLTPQEEIAAPQAGDPEVIFRVYSGEYPVPDALYLAGVHANLGDAEPNRLAMYDDGSHGDQVAGDKVWSYKTRLPAGKTVLYVYTNSGEPGRWTGLDLPDVRRVSLPASSDGRRLYQTIESFGEIYMQADGWHTNGPGYALIAQALLETLKQNEAFQKHLTP